MYLDYASVWPYTGGELVYVSNCLSSRVLKFIPRIKSWGVWADETYRSTKSLRTKWNIQQRNPSDAIQIEVRIQSKEARLYSSTKSPPSCPTVSSLPLEVQQRSQR